MSLDATALVVIAKEPVPGRCKTRLCPPLDPADAAALAEAALADTLETLAGVPARRHVLALEGDPGPWVPEVFEVVEQCEGDLGDRLAGAFEQAGAPAFLVGMDTPQLAPAEVVQAVERLWDPGVDAVLGPARDGGYWSIGLRSRQPGAFDGVTMSSARTAAEQRAALARLGLRHAELPAMTDFDDIDAAIEVARACPGSRFAARLAQVRWARAA